MKRVALLFNHTLIPEQNDELSNEWEVEEFLVTPTRIHDGWGNIDIEKNYNDVLNNVLDWLSNETEKEDLIFVQGQYGITYQVVSWALENNRIPIYAFTGRNVSSEIICPDSSVTQTSNFKHRYFAEYMPLNQRY